MNWLATNAPLVNTGLLVLGLILVLVALVWILHNAPKWSGVPQHGRIAYLEGAHEDTKRRLSALEDNHDLQYRGVIESVEGLRVEVRRLFSTVGALPGLTARMALMEDHRADLEQQVQSFRDLGCGLPDCPHRKAVEPKA